MWLGRCMSLFGVELGGYLEKIICAHVEKYMCYQTKVDLSN
jgi:hypothetical protein